MRTTTKLTLCFCLILGYLSHSIAQNLVVNPSFELTSSNCANSTGEKFTVDLLDWDDANSGADSCSSPDLFSACNLISGSPAPTHMPNTVLGYQYSRTGTRHAGFITHQSIDGYREYIQGHTSAPLIAGQQYCVSMYISLANNVQKATNNIGVYFSTTNYQRDPCPGPNTSLINVTPQLNYSCTPITDTLNWVRLQWTYTATGGEQYFVIGNFYNNAGTTIVSNNSSALNYPFAYYYIDDVSITPNQCCYTDIVKVNNVCNGNAPITLSTGQLPGNSCLPASTGTWSGTGITDPSAGTFDPALAGTGTHTISFSLSCGYTATTAITVASCLSVCKTGSVLTVSDGTPPYTWQVKTTYTDCSSCPGGNCLPPFCSGVIVETWSTTATNTNTYTTSSFPVKVFDNAGINYMALDLSSIQNCVTTGINENIQPNGISTFPNPAQHEVTFKFDNINDQKAEIVLLDILGKQVAEYSVEIRDHKTKIDVSYLPAGIFYYKIDLNQKIIKGKITVSK